MEILSIIMYPDDEKLTVREMLEYWQTDKWQSDSMELSDAVADLKELARILGVEREV